MPNHKKTACLILFLAIFAMHTNRDTFFASAEDGAGYAFINQAAHVIRRYLVFF